MMLFLEIEKNNRMYQAKNSPTLDFLAELHGEVR